MKGLLFYELSGSLRFEEEAGHDKTGDFKA